MRTDAEDCVLRECNWQIVPLEGNPITGMAELHGLTGRSGSVARFAWRPFLDGEYMPEHSTVDVAIVTDGRVDRGRYQAMLYCRDGVLWATSWRMGADSPLKLGRAVDLLEEIPDGGDSDTFIEISGQRFRWRDPHYTTKADPKRRKGTVPFNSPACVTVAYESTEGAVLGLIGDRGYAAPDSLLPASWLDTCIGLDDYIA